MVYGNQDIIKFSGETTIDIAYLTAVISVAIMKIAVASAFSYKYV